MARRRGARADRGAVPRPQPLALQEPAVLRRRRRADRDRRARHGASRRPDPPHAADGVRLPGRLRRHLGAAAAQRLRLRVADLPGDPAQPGPAAVGPEVPGARRSAPCSRCRRRWPPPASSRRSASPFSAGRAREAAAAAREVDRFSLARDVRLRRRSACSPASCPGLVIDALAPVVTALVGGGACRRRPGIAWLSIVPIAESRSSYNGLLVSLFIAFSAAARGLCDPPLRLARAAPRAGLGLRLPRSEPGDAIHRRQLRAADPPRVRHARVPRPRAGRDAAARRPPAGAPRGRPAAIWSGTASTRRSRPRSASPPTGSTICSS